MHLNSDAIPRIILVALISNFCFNYTNGNYISILPTFVKHFKAPSPLPLHYNASISERIRMIKGTSKYDLSLRWTDKKANKEGFLLVLSDKTDSLSIGNININQQIYFIFPNFTVHEKYSINDHAIDRIIGQIENTTYYPRKDLEDNFIKRRNDFYGLQLVGLTDESQETDIINLNEAVYYSSNDTYDVTNHVRGPHYRILKSLEETLNFTTKLYHRKSGGWGIPVIFQNGSIEVSDGMVRDIMLGKADLIIASLSLLYNRYLLISYLHPLAPGQGGIFVKKTSILEGMDFKVFIRPFRNWLWIVMIISSFVVALCIIGVLKIQGSSQMDLKDCMRIMVITIQTNFGSGNFNSLPKLSMEAPRLIIITALLMGNIIWLSYNGSLLSALITPSVIKPFDDLESLAKTNFRLNTSPKDTSYGSYWTHTQPNSAKREVYDSNMDESSFHLSVYEALIATLRFPKQAFYGSWSQIFNNNVEIACKVEMLVFLPMSYNSFGVKKNWPYLRSMNYQITKLRQSGMVDILLERNSLKQPQCLADESENSNDQKVPLHKVILPFSIIIIGIGIAFTVLSGEHLFNTLNMEPKREKTNILLSIGKRVVKRDTVIFIPTSGNEVKNYEK